MAARPPPPLPDEIVEEILVRVPPDDPARLVRAALACKRWRRLVSGPGFRRRFRELRPKPPVLGFLRRGFVGDIGEGTVRFIPAWSSGRPRADRRGWRALDSRNGRVLLCSEPFWPWHEPAGVPAFAVWDPVADELRELPALPDLPDTFNAAVLCAECCDHLDCRREPFTVVFVATHPAGTSAYLYTSEADAWSEPTSAPHSAFLIEMERGAHVRNALYFVISGITGPRILKYDLGTREMTVIDPPPMSNLHIVLMTVEGGGLGCITPPVVRNPPVVVGG